MKLIITTENNYQNDEVYFVPCNSGGSSGTLNTMVLESIGFNFKEFPNSNELSDGFAFRRTFKNQSVVFIVTVGGNRGTAMNLSQNLQNAFTRFQKELMNKTLWIPLMGSGHGGLSESESSNHIFDAIKKINSAYLPSRITIACPQDIRNSDVYRRISDRAKTLEKEYENTVNSNSSKDQSKQKRPVKIKWSKESTKNDTETSHTEIDPIKSDLDNHSRIVTELSNFPNRNFWWINASKRHFAESPPKVGDVYDYPIKNKAGNHKPRFSQLKQGDLLIGYDTKGERTVYGCFVLVSLTEDFASIKLIHSFENPIHWSEISRLSLFVQSVIVSSKVSSPLNRLGVAQFNELILKGITDLDQFLEALKSPNLLDYNLNQLKTISDVVLDDQHSDEEDDEDESNDTDSDPEKSTDSIDFQLDNVETKTDLLQRKNLANALARMIKTQIFSKKAHANGEKSTAFMIHLQGEWGTGKSTFLSYLTQSLNSDEDKWLVVEFNAWQNQHISPPWWTMLDTITSTLRKQKKDTINWLDKQEILLNEFMRRMFYYRTYTKIIPILILSLLGFIAFAYKADLTIKINYWLGNEDPEKIGLLPKFLTAITGLATIIGIAHSFSNFLATPIVMKNAKEAQSFQSKASDPMSIIKKHFNGLVNDVNNEGLQLAIYIDDLDRCEKKYVIELLEGIQTLFKDKKVLYVVAGDKNWISSCFDSHYCDFKERVESDYHTLGELFIEKAFQLSFRLPALNDDLKQKFWKSILNVQETEQKEYISKADLERTFNEQLEESTSIAAVTESMSKTEGINLDDLVAIASEKAISDQKEVNHLLLKHYQLLEPVPRSIKRIANEYNVNRTVLINETTNYSQEHLFRWTILENCFPKIAQIIKRNPAVLNDPKQVSELISGNKSAELNRLIRDNDNNHGGALTEAQVNVFIGKNKF